MTTNCFKWSTVGKYKPVPMEKYTVLKGVEKGGFEGPCLVNNAEHGATRNVERDRNERTTGAGKGSTEDNERNVSATGFL